MSSADQRSARRTSAGVHSGFFSSSNAAAPATIGAAKDVPETRA